MEKLNFEKILGYIGFVMVAGAAVYLALKVFGIIHSPATEDVLLTISVGQVFYNGYLYKATQEIERKLKGIEKKLELS